MLKMYQEPDARLIVERDDSYLTVDPIIYVFLEGCFLGRWDRSAW